ncbi:tyrosine-protein kinase Lyn-like [Octopus sinensis]|uniref:Tyrosine-protein kinase Lyn-like n=1 Tax=Octopus sinensis TaxID=2607531 RepID=A0A6P7U4R0_9MOLL|nr:tyrosine-protein kinase Lyn-like [Octopus sinensis]
MVKNQTVDKKLFLQEAKLMYRLDHKNLVKLLGISFNDDSVVLVLEFMERGQLRNLLRADNGKNISADLLARIALQVTFGMIYLEEMNLVHRDLRGENILISDKFVLSYLDIKFPIKWTALEALTKMEFTIKSDVWSFGVLLWEMVTFGDTPYRGLFEKTNQRDQVEEEDDKIHVPTLYKTSEYANVLELWFLENDYEQ